jgi:hypothetical protein
MVVEEDVRSGEGPSPHLREDFNENEIDPNAVGDAQGAVGGMEPEGSHHNGLGASGGPRENILDKELISELGLDSATVLAIEGRMKIALTQARYQYAAEHDDDMEGALRDIRKKTDETINVMHGHWEERHLKSAGHWRDQIDALNKENDLLCKKYQSSVLMQKELVCKGLERQEETMEMSRDLEVLRREKEVLLTDRNAKVWLESQCPEGQGEDDEKTLLRMPEHLREAGGRICRRRGSIGQLNEGEGKGGS